MSTVRKNFIYNTIYQILIIVLPLFTIPYISRIIGAEGVGTYTYTYSVAGYFVVFAMIGIGTYGNRKIAQTRENKEKLSEEFCSIYSLQFVLSLIVIIAYCIYLVFFVQENKVLSIIQTLYVFTGMLDITWLFNGLEEFKKLTIRNLIVKTISIICIFVFVKTKNDLFTYALIMVTSFFVSNLLLWPYVKKYINIKIPKKEKIREHIKPCLVLFIPIIASTIYRYIDKIMIGKMVNMAEVGYYTYAEKLITIPSILIDSLSAVMLPKISNLISKGKKEESKKYLNSSMEFGMFLAMPLTFGIYTVADNFMPLFLGEEFTKSGEMLKILSLSIPFIIWTNVIRKQYLMPNEKDKQYTLSVVIGLITNVTTNIILIPKYGGVGAAIATCIAEIVTMLIQTKEVIKEFKIDNFLKYTIKFLVPGIIMFFAINILPIYSEDKLILIISQVLLGTLIYCILCIKYIIKISNIKNLSKRDKTK